jgi:L-2-hydroxyglutarate oxidase LhgO
MASQYDLTIVGGGIIGLATALKIGRAHTDLRLLLLEKEAELARHLPSRFTESALVRRRPQRTDGILR